MIEVKLTLYDPVELHAVQQLYSSLLERRMKITAAMQAQAAQPTREPTHTEKVAEAIEAVNEAHGAALAQLAEGPVPEPVSVTPREIFKKYLDAHGFAAARKKLDAFGLQKIGDLKPEDAPAFLASLSEPA